MGLMGWIWSPTAALPLLTTRKCVGDTKWQGEKSQVVTQGSLPPETSPRAHGGDLALQEQSLKPVFPQTKKNANEKKNSCMILWLKSNSNRLGTEMCWARDSGGAWDAHHLLSCSILTTEGWIGISSTTGAAFPPDFQLCNEPTGLWVPLALLQEMFLNVPAVPGDVQMCPLGTTVSSLSSFQPQVMPLNTNLKPAHIPAALIGQRFCKGSFSREEKLNYSQEMLSVCL